MEVFTSLELNLEQYGLNIHPHLASLLAISFFSLAFLYAIWQLFRQPERGDTIVVVGSMGSGKTVLYYQLLQGIFRETHSSMTSNFGNFVPKCLEADRNVKMNAQKIIDFPGHGSHRMGFSGLFPSIKAVLLLVDGSEEVGLQDAAWYLSELMTSAALVARRVPVFVALNKADLLAPTDARALLASLEREMEKRRLASLSKLADMSPHASDSDKRPLPNAPFCFESAVLPVTSGRISAKYGQLDPLIAFLRSVM